MQLLKETEMELDRKASYCYFCVNLGPLLNGKICNIWSIVWVSMKYRNHGCLANHWNACVMTFSVPQVRKLTQTSHRQRGCVHIGYWKWSICIILTTCNFQANQESPQFFFLSFLFLLTAALPGINLSLFLCTTCTIPSKEGGMLCLTPPGQGWPQPNLLGWAVFVSNERKFARGSDSRYTHTHTPA